MSIQNFSHTVSKAQTIYYYYCAPCEFFTRIVSFPNKTRIIFRSFFSVSFLLLLCRSALLEMAGKVQCLTRFYNLKHGFLCVFLFWANQKKAQTKFKLLYKKYVYIRNQFHSGQYNVMQHVCIHIHVTKNDSYLGKVLTVAMINIAQNALLLLCKWSSPSLL